MSENTTITIHHAAATVLVRSVGRGSETSEVLRTLLIRLHDSGHGCTSTRDRLGSGGRI